MAVASPITTPTVIRSDSGRFGIVVLDNQNVTDNTHKSAWVLYGDNTWRQESRSTMNVIADAPTGFPAFQYLRGLGPGA